MRDNVGFPGRRKRRSNVRRRRGTAVLEFAISLPLLFLTSIVPFVIGVYLDRFLTVKQTARSSGHMYSRGVDFSKTGVQNKIRDAGANLQISRTNSGGQGVVYVSTVVQASSGVNMGRSVVSHRIRMGDSSIAGSTIAMPASTDNRGNVVNYENDGQAVATLPAGLNVGAGQRLYVAEVFHEPRGIPMPELFRINRLNSRVFF